jgi:hypothetical protein
MKAKRVADREEAGIRSSDAAAAVSDPRDSKVKAGTVRAALGRRLVVAESLSSA